MRRCWSWSATTTIRGWGEVRHPSRGFDEGGAIAKVVVGDNSETPGIGTKAIEQLPERFVGLSTAEEVSAVDVVTGASVTSRAIIAGVRQALGL